MIKHPHSLPLALMLALALAYPGHAQDTEPAITDATARLDKLEKRAAEIETHLGRPVQPPNSMNNIERRLQTLEKKISTLERDLDQLDSRVKRLEARR